MLYDGYLVKTYTDGWGGFKEERTYIGKTTAISKKQAENNFRYRTKGKALKSYTRDYPGDSCITEYFIAEPADTTTKPIKKLLEPLNVDQPKSVHVPDEPEYEQMCFDFSSEKGW